MGKPKLAFEEAFLVGEAQQFFIDQNRATTPPPLEPTGTYCSICGKPQLHSPRGDTCENGHGGVDLVETPPSVSRSRQLPAHTEPDPKPAATEPSSIHQGLRGEVTGRLSASVLQAIMTEDDASVHEVIIGVQDAITQFVLLTLEATGRITRAE